MIKDPIYVEHQVSNFEETVKNAMNTINWDKLNPYERSLLDLIESATCDLVNSTVSGGPMSDTVKEAIEKYKQAVIY